MLVPCMLMWKVPPLPAPPLRIIPPPPVAMSGWLFDSVLLSKSRSPPPVPLAIMSKRSPFAAVNALFLTVTFVVDAPPAAPSMLTPSLPLLVPLAPKVSVSRVRRFSEPEVL